ncbi:MAG: hypothetical protein M1828_003342 [Chrysothrix sp. TS-e1954]|nr:MAG: hypothetical protein M1828_003342 [Chrysothrix sp. TS-e1954]
MASTKSLHVAVLLVSKVQLLDLASVDLFHMLSQEYLRSSDMPTALISSGIEHLKISYVSACTASSSGPAQAPLTASISVPVTASLRDANVQPGRVDVLLIPGPEPSYVPTNEEKNFVRGHFAAENTAVLTVCTGGFVAAHAGILDGRNCTGVRALLPQLRKIAPHATFDGSRRWVKDGDLWTSGGITNGLDMVSAFLRERWPGILSDTVCAMAEVGDRPEIYALGNNTESM